jgi:Flp pilus assembly protein CpaB
MTAQASAARTLQATPGVAPRRRWSPGHALIIATGILAALFTMLSLRAADERTSVVVAQRNISAGERIDTSAFRVQSLRVDSALRTQLFTKSEMTALATHVALTTIRDGDPILKSALVPSATSDGRRAMSIPVAPERAVGGKLRAGDRVDVYSTGNRSAAIANNVEVLDATRLSSGPLRASDTQTIVLAVTAEQASRIATVVGSPDIVIVQATGASTASSDGTTTPSDSGSPGIRPTEAPSSAPLKGATGG